MKNKIKCFFGVHDKTHWIDGITGVSGFDLTVAGWQCERCGKWKLKIFYATERRSDETKTMPVLRQ